MTHARRDMSAQHRDSTKQGVRGTGSWRSRGGVGLKDPPQGVSHWKMESAFPAEGASTTEASAAGTTRAAGQQAHCPFRPGSYIPQGPFGSVPTGDLKMIWGKIKQHLLRIWHFMSLSVNHFHYLFTSEHKYFSPRLIQPWETQRFTFCCHLLVRKQMVREDHRVLVQL